MAWLLERRSVPEGQLSGALTAVDIDTLRPQLVAELADAQTRVMMARRFYNDAVRELARQYGCLLVDHTQFREFDDPRMWAFDRIHMSRLGHKHLAAYVLAELGIPHTLKLPELPPFEAPHWRESIRTESRWLATEVIPLLRRRINGVREGDTLLPKWPEPIRPADGMKRLARARAGDAVEVRSRAGERHAG